MAVIQTVSLSNLKKGESGIIDSFSDDSLSLKFMEMGCLQGVKIKVCSIAPLGDPIAISVNDYQLALRKDEAESILIIVD